MAFSRLISRFLRDLNCGYSETESVPKTKLIVRKHFVGLYGPTAEWLRRLAVNTEIAGSRRERQGKFFCTQKQPPLK